MFPVSERFASAIRTSHEVVTVAEVWRSGAFTGRTLSILDGSVTLDESSKVRRALSLSSSDVDLMPDDLAATLTPVDTDLRVFSGVRFTEGDTELVPVGVFRIETPSRQSLTSALSIDGADYSSVLAAARFVTPWNTAKGALITAQIAAMVTDVLPWVEVVDLTGSAAKSTGAVWERDRWDAVEDLAASIGAEAAFDAEGRLVIRPTPVVADAPVWEVDSMTETSVLLDAGVALSTSGVYNAVVASSSDADVPPVSATVYATDGPLAYRPGFKRPRFFASPTLKSYKQCVEAASGILVRSLAYSQQLTPQVAPNPAIDVGDTVSVQLPGRAPVLRAITRATIPLGMAAMPLEVRASVAIAEEGLT